MNDRAIHQANNGQQQQGREVGAQQSPPPSHNNNRKPSNSTPHSRTTGTTISSATKQNSRCAIHGIIGKEYDRLAHVRIIAAWKLSVEKKKLELCSGKPPPLPGPSIWPSTLSDLVCPGSSVSVHPPPPRVQACGPGPSLTWYAPGPSLTRYAPGPAPLSYPFLTQNSPYLSVYH